MTPQMKKLLLFGGVAAGVTGVIFFAAKKASAAPNPPGPAPAPKVVGKLDANTALACCRGSFKSMMGRESQLPGEVFDLLTPNSVLPPNTVYAFFKDRLFKWEAANRAGYFECDDVDVAKLHQYTGVGAPSRRSAPQQIPGLFQRAA